MPTSNPPRSSAPAPDGHATYTVKAGDTLGTIAQALLGSASRWKELAALNADRLPNPDRLEIGLVLTVPAPSASPPVPTPPSAEPPPRGLFWQDGFGRKVALTFDDGPHPQHTPRMLDVLRRHGARATFFVVGQNVRRHPELVRQLVAEGHLLGNHSDTHPDFTRLPPDAVARELAATQAAVDAALGKHHPLEQVRPPFGAMNAGVREVLRTLGLAAVLWNVDSNDWRYPDADEKILANIFTGPERVQARGGVILFHDIHPQGARVMDAVLTRLAQEGFTVVGTDALLREKYPEAQPSVA